MRFGGHHAPRPEGRIKVTDHQIWINVLPPDGVPRRYAAYKGESLLEVLTRHRTPGIFADDRGGDGENQMKPFQVPYDWYSAGGRTGQDSVVIGHPWFERLNPMPSTERNVLAKRSLPNSEFTRLASCIQVLPELNEMIVTVGNNQSTDGDWFTGCQGDAF